MTAEGTRSRDLRRVCRRRTAIWTAAAVAVVVVIVPVTLIGRGSDQRPTPVHPPPLTSVAPEDATGLPQGAPAGVYFLHDGALVEGVPGRVVGLVAGLAPAARADVPAGEIGAVRIHFPTL